MGVALKKVGFGPDAPFQKIGYQFDGNAGAFDDGFTGQYLGVFDDAVLPIGGCLSWGVVMALASSWLARLLAGATYCCGRRDWWEEGRPHPRPLSQWEKGGGVIQEVELLRYFSGYKSPV